MHPRGRNSIVKRISGAVVGKSCPICLCQVEIRSAVVLRCMHAYCVGCISRWSELNRRCPLCNARFSSWFCKINVHNNTFSEQRLLPLGSGDTVYSAYRDRRDGLLRRQRAEFFQRQRLIRNSRQQSSLSRNKQLPNRRSFGRANDEGVDVTVMHERIKQWRASIYEKQLWAVPPSTKSSLMQRIWESTDAKEMMLRRIEPWIRRELQAVLKDPDPTVIVHVVTSLFISTYKKKSDNFRGQVGDESDCLSPLRPFLQEHADLFWHELRCFAESSFSMEAYDKVVEYE
ncbi:hypothetical protein F511_21893 [Dorcoceras hygrometricum]|uniref:RING-type E3 ubiquitin transferase n=1 Tax=Dorcoceras hygrometricum TaxID=472368 RepID=A0A2Z7AIH1_9LAMI|nr:hypothetical protein F511_17822 [Dorcoceras hygrometricum]KZV36544.1 hypothetical protein F511_21893 [Dorcoceras hygrometricum]